MLAVLRFALAAVLVLVATVGCSLLPFEQRWPPAVPTIEPGPVPARPSLDRASRPVRIRIPSLGIDLPVVRSERRVPGGTPGYPACDVALWWELFDLPGKPGVAWIMAHAQQGMFLPLLESAQRHGARSLRGRRVEVQLRDGRLLVYRTFRVRPRNPNSDLSLADAGRRRGEHRLILQTSTGVGSAPKLLVAARLVGATSTTEPPPRPKPRACG
jgi:hypothetical protein